MTPSCPRCADDLATVRRLASKAKDRRENGTGPYAVELDELALLRRRVATCADGEHRPAFIDLTTGEAA